jgi:uncharacterized protein (UPF0332 family)
MSFERYRSQILLESFFKCADFQQFFNLNHSILEAFTLDKKNAFTLDKALKEDAKDFYFKGCQSLKESIYNFSNRQYSWAIVKAYYSVFYMIKSDLALKDFALIRHKCIYYLQTHEGSSLVTKGRQSSKRREYSGDHKSAINYYKDLFSNSDKLLSQEIDGMNAYDWLMKKRERINYQERNFKEPDCPDFLDYIDTRVTAGEFHELLNEIKNDNGFILTFQTEFAPLAIPIQRAILTKNSFVSNGISDYFTTNQLDYLNKFELYDFS